MNGEKTKIGLWLPSIAAFLITLIVLIVKGELKDFFNVYFLWGKVLWPMLRSMFFLVLGLSAAMFIEAMGWTQRLARLAAPLCRWAHLPLVAGASFTSAIISGAAANAILSEAWEKKQISAKALLLANLLNGSWPTFMVHLPSSMVIAASLAGKAGFAYTTIMFTAASIRLLGAAFMGRIFLNPPNMADGATEENQKNNGQDIWPILQQRLKKRLVNLLSIAVPVFYLVSLANYLGFFEFMRFFAADHLPGFFLPAEAAALVVFSLAAEFTSGFAAAGALISGGSLSMPQAAAALILGNIIATPIRVLRWQLPTYIGYFQFKQGFLLIMCNQLFRVFSLSLSLFIFWQIVV